MLLDKNQLAVVRTHRLWRVRLSNSISRPKSTSFAVKRRGARVGRTLMKYDDFRVVLTALQANMRIPEHKTDGRISVHVLSGHIRLNASGRTFDSTRRGTVP
jgi:quercetin dioxygenase-like cupin family protein